MRKLFALITVFFVIAPIFVDSTPSLNQEKEKTKKEEKEKKKGVKGALIGGVEGGVTGGVQGGVIGGVQGGILGGVEGGVQGGVIGGVSKIVDEDFIKEPKKIIELRIEHLEIHPTDTIHLNDGVKIKTESGSRVKYSYSSEYIPRIEIELTPTIIEKKGIEFRIKIFHGERIIKEETVFTRNYEPIIVELMEDEKKKIKLSDKITPMIQTIEPAKAYPGKISELKMVNHMLLMNNELLTRGGLRAINEENRPIFLFFYIKEKGVYVLSFKPFDGAEPLGVVRNKTIKIKHDEDYFEWVSQESILPEGKWLVWVRINPEYNPPQDKFDKIQIPQKERWSFFGIGTGENILERFFKK